MESSTNSNAPRSLSGFWISTDQRLRLELTPDGSYHHSRADTGTPSVGRYAIDGDHLRFVDGAGFETVGRFDHDVLHVAGSTLRRRKIVLVTGASSGIGRAIALRLAAAGHMIVLGARRVERLDELASEIKSFGGDAVVVPLDVTDRRSMEAFAAAALERFGRIDVLVANAGVMPLSPLRAGSVDEWDQMIDVNVRGLLHGIAATLPTMLEQGTGHVVTIASVGAYEVSPTAAVYCGTKFAARAITEGLRLESPPGIRVTTVSPGVTDSELASTITNEEASAAMVHYRAVSVPADAIARGVAYAVDERSDVDVNEIVVRPTAQRPL